MSDEHHGPPHDLPMPKAKVYRDFHGWWRWEHSCRYRGGVPNVSYPQASQAMALRGALRHLERCV